MDAASVLMDTDIGCDCDDAGALAMMHAFQDQGEVSLIGVTHATAIANGAACIDAINRFCGHPSIPVGQPADSDFMNQADFDVYATKVARAFPGIYYMKERPEDALHLQRRLLAKAAPGSVVFVTIGPLRNLALLLSSSPDALSPLSGRELVQQAVREVVIMGGCFDPDHPCFQNGEYNILCDIPSAQKVMEHCPVPVVFSGMEIGLQLLTGASLLREEDRSNPVWLSYRAHLDMRIEKELHGKIPDLEDSDLISRPSWDQTAVYYAAKGAENFCTLSRPGRITVTDAGTTVFSPAPKGNHRYIAALLHPEQTRMEMERSMLPQNRPLLLHPGLSQSARTSLENCTAQ